MASSEDHMLVSKYLVQRTKLLPHTTNQHVVDKNGLVAVLSCWIDPGILKFKEIQRYANQIREAYWRFWHSQFKTEEANEALTKEVYGGYEGNSCEKLQHLIEDAADDYESYHIGKLLADEVEQLAVDCVGDRSVYNMEFNFGFQRLLRRLRRDYWTNYTDCKKELLVLFFLTNCDLTFVREHFDHHCDCKAVDGVGHIVHQCWPNLRELMLSWPGGWTDETIHYVVT